MRHNPVRRPWESWNVVKVVAVSTTIVVAGIIVGQYMLSVPDGAMATAASQTKTVAEPAIPPTILIAALACWVLFALLRERDD